MTQLEQLSPETIEGLLDNAQLQIAVYIPRKPQEHWWTVRRNGRTQTWKTRPGHFQIPIKAGMRSCAYLRHDNLMDFRIKPDVP